MIYFIQAASGPIKIGYTKRDVKSRLSSLQTGCPETLWILKVIDGDKRLEKELHAKFNPTRKKGEWFDFSEELNKFIEAAEAAEEALDDEGYGDRNVLLSGYIKKAGKTEDEFFEEIRRSSDRFMNRLGVAPHNIEPKAKTMKQVLKDEKQRILSGEKCIFCKHSFHGYAKKLKCRVIGRHVRPTSSCREFNEKG